jgi:hypothetical protein
MVVDDTDGPDEADVMVIEDEVIEMLTTASPLVLFGLAGGALLAQGGLISPVRRRLG